MRENTSVDRREQAAALTGRQGTGKRVLLAEAKIFADAVLRHLKQAPGVGQIQMAGSFRRRKETVGDLDVMTTCIRAGPLMDRLAGCEAVAEGWPAADENERTPAERDAA